MNNLSLLLLALATGAGVAVMTVFNSRLGLLLGGPFSAATASFTVALSAVLLVAFATRQPMPVSAGLAAAPWWMWTGGLFSAMFIVVSTWLAPRLGVALTLATILVGQLLAALVLDHYGMFGGNVIKASPTRLLGVALLLTGIVLLRWRS